MDDRRGCWTSGAIAIERRRWHRITFLAAGAYDICWGLWSAFDPQWLFRFAGMPLLNHPEIFAGLGMVVGLYGILCFEVARSPERGWLLAGVGLLGRVLGPIGAVVLIWQGEWPMRAAVLCLTNDLTWWIPFGLYLYDARSAAFWAGWRGIDFEALNLRLANTARFLSPRTDLLGDSLAGGLQQAMLTSKIARTARDYCHSHAAGRRIAAALSGVIGGSDIRGFRGCGRRQ